VAYLSRTTVRWLQKWLQCAAIREAAVFRRLVGRGRVGKRLHEDSVSDIFKRAAVVRNYSIQSRTKSKKPFRLGTQDHASSQLSNAEF